MNEGLGTFRSMLSRIVSRLECTFCFLYCVFLDKRLYLVICLTLLIRAWFTIQYVCNVVFFYRFEINKTTFQTIQTHTWWRQTRSYHTTYSSTHRSLVTQVRLYLLWNSTKQNINIAECNGANFTNNALVISPANLAPKAIMGILVVNSVVR